MAVHTLGSTSPALYGNNTTPSYHEIVPTSTVTMPGNGYIWNLFAYFGAVSGTQTAYLLLFDSSYNLLAQSPAISAGGMGWQEGVLASPYYLASGATVRAGWWCAGNQIFDIASSGNWKGGAVSSPQSAGSFGQPGSPFVQGWPDWYLQWIDPLVVTSVSPQPVGVGQTLTITGSGFVGGSISSVKFGGIAASFTIVNDTTITATVPVGATTGTLTITSDHGNGSIAVTIASRRIWRSGVWTFAPATKHWRSSAWSQDPVGKTWRSGAWSNES